jgi:hypothetical protein
VVNAVDDDVERALAAYGGDNFTYHSFGTFSIRPRVQIVTSTAAIVITEVSAAWPVAAEQPMPAQNASSDLTFDEADASLPPALPPALPVRAAADFAPAADAEQFQPALPSTGDWSRASSRHAAPQPSYYELRAPAVAAAAVAAAPVVPGYSPTPQRLLPAGPAAGLSPPAERAALPARPFTSPIGQPRPANPRAGRPQAGYAGANFSQAGSVYAIVSHLAETQADLVPPPAERSAKQPAGNGPAAADMNIFQMAWDSEAASRAARDAAAPGESATDAAATLPGEEDLFRRL